MKERISVFILILLVFCLSFSGTAQAVSITDLMEEPGGRWIGSTMDHIGSYTYWERVIFEEKRWKSENCPDPIMGDANIDGKVNAVDALAALYFGLYGNYLTCQVSGLAKQTMVHSLTNKFNNYDVTYLQKSDGFWVMYCRINSPFFADVTKDCIVNAKDSLEILKYSVGKPVNFSENDFTSITPYFVYVPKPEDYFPGFYDDLVVKQPSDVTPSDQ